MNGVDQPVPGICREWSERCYYCKRALFETVVRDGWRNTKAAPADGSNIDDEGDYQCPGMKDSRVGDQKSFREVDLLRRSMAAVARSLSFYP